MFVPQGRIGVLASLPRNDPALAEAARAAGADGLKVHINVEHRAAGTVFGSLADEAPRLRQVLDVGLPTGLVVGAAGTVHPDEIAEAQRMGFDYFDAYASDAPANYVEACGRVTPMVALGPGDGADQAEALVGAGVAALEASTLEPERYGTPLSLGTVARVTSVCRRVPVPVTVPSQHCLEPADVGHLAAAGAAAVLLGAVVTGDDPQTLTTAIQLFARQATAEDATTQA